MTPDPTLNAELGKLLGATPAREWRVRMPDGELRRAGTSKSEVCFWGKLWGGEVIEIEVWLRYDSDRDLMAQVEDELERRGLAEAYGDRLAAAVFGQNLDDLWQGDYFFALAHAPPDLRARAARGVLKAGEKGQC